MRQKYMLRIFITMVMLTFGISLYAQDDLNISRAFELYGHSKGCTMVRVWDADIRGKRISVFKSLTYEKYHSEIKAIINEDRKNAKKVREVIHDGKLQSGCLMMPQNKKGENRFIVFSLPVEDTGAIIYLEGNITIDDVMKICYSNKH